MLKQSEKSYLLFLVISTDWDGVIAPHFPEITLAVRQSTWFIGLNFLLMKFECSFSFPCHGGYQHRYSLVYIIVQNGLTFRMHQLFIPLSLTKYTLICCWCSRIFLLHTLCMCELTFTFGVFTSVAYFALISHWAVTWIASAHARARTQLSWRHLALVREQISEPLGCLCQSVHPILEKYNNTCTGLNESQSQTHTHLIFLCSLLLLLCIVWTILLDSQPTVSLWGVSVVTAYWAVKSLLWLTTATLDDASGASHVRLSMKLLTVCVYTAVFVSHDNCCNLLAIVASVCIDQQFGYVVTIHTKKWKPEHPPTFLEVLSFKIVVILHRNFYKT